MRRFEVQFNRFLEVGKSLFLGLALAGDIDLQAQGDIPTPLASNGSGKRSLHASLFHRHACSARPSEPRLAGRIPSEAVLRFAPGLPSTVI